MAGMEMTAYELADKLDLEPYGIYGEQSANMLRQQADRIAELEKEKQNFKYDPDTGEPLIDGYPLYSGLPTPQTKPLNDEEIIQVRQTTKANNTDNWADSLAFARAIEERILGNDRYRSK